MTPRLSYTPSPRPGHAPSPRLGAPLRPLTSPLRPGVSDLNKLVLALKLRFIDQLDAEGRGEQLHALEVMYQGERARLADLAAHEEWGGGLLDDWLGHEIDQIDRRIEWVRGLRG